MAQIIDRKLQDAQTALTSVLGRCSAGEDIRVWYSHNPDEMCGMYWLLTQLRPLKQRGSIYLVKLPEWEYTGENTVSMRNGWGEIGPGEWGHYLPLQQEAQPAFLSLCATKWTQLEKENAPLVLRCISYLSMLVLFNAQVEALLCEKIYFSCFAIPFK